jgi:hypothetical protein
MANAVGSLVVKLGLDAAEFTRGLTKSEYQAKQFADGLSNKIAVGVVKAEIAMQALGKAVQLVTHAIPDLIGQAGHFQDLAEKTGANAEALAAMSVAAKVGGVDLHTMAKASVNLSVGLAKINDESKGVGAALKAIGIPLKEFKALDPAAQMQRIAQALGGLKDSGAKTAIADALFGKLGHGQGGADMLPFLKELGEGVGRVNILTAEQIKLADEFADRQARARAEINLYAQALATEAIPALTAVTNATKDLIKEFLGLDGSVNELKASGAILDFAESAALGLATVLESAIGVAKGIRAIGGSIQSVYADAKLLISLTPAGRVTGMITGAESPAELLEKRNKIAHEANQRYVDLWNYDGTKITTAIKKSFAEQRRLLDPENRREAARFARQADQAGGKRDVNTDALVKGTKHGASSAGAVLRKELDGQLKAIREFAEQQRDGYAFANQYLRGVYDDGITSLADFFEKQGAIRDAGLQAQLAALDKEIAALEAYKSKAVKPEDRVAAENKIAEAVQHRAGVIQRASQSNILATQDEAKAFKQLAYSYYDFLAGVQTLQGNTAGASAIRIAKQTQEAQELLTKVGFDPSAAQAQAEAYGKLLTQTEALSRAQNDYGRLVETAGIKERTALLDAQASGLSEIDTLRQIGAIRQDALGAMGEMVVKARELAAALGTPEAALFAEKLALQFKQAAAEADPLLQKVRDIGREMGQGIAGQFEEALLARGKTMKERVLGLVNGISDTIQRSLTKTFITKPLEDYLSNLIGGTASGGGLLGGLFGSGKKSNVAGPGDPGWGMDLGGAGEMASLTASMTAQTMAYTTGTTALAALTMAANSAAAALSSISMSGGGGGGMFGFLGSAGQAAFSQTTLGSSGFGTGLAYGNMDIGGFLATGGPALPNTNYRVNEQGPELLDVNGKSFLMMGNQRGKVTPLGKGGGGDTWNISVQADRGMTPEQTMNYGRNLRRGMQSQAARRGRET